MTTQMDLEGIMLSEISQTKTNTLLYYLYVESKKAKLVKTESRMVITRGLGVGELERRWTKYTNLQLEDE